MDRKDHKEKINWYVEKKTFFSICILIGPFLIQKKMLILMEKGRLILSAPIGPFTFKKKYISAQSGASWVGVLECEHSRLITWCHS
jgi:hypothetical protein